MAAGLYGTANLKKNIMKLFFKGDFITAPLKQFELIETMLLDNGQIFLFEDHIERLKSAAKFFLFNINEDKITKSLFKKIDKKYSNGKYKIRLTLNKWGKVTYTFNFVTLIPDVVKIIISDKTIYSENKFQYFKTTNRELYNSELTKYNRAGYFEVIFFNEKDELAEGCTTNIFIKKKRCLADASNTQRHFAWYISKLFYEY